MKRNVLSSIGTAVLYLCCTSTLLATEETLPDEPQAKEKKPLFAGSYIEAGLISIENSSPVFNDKEQTFSEYSSYKAQFNSSVYFGIGADTQVILNDRSWVDQMDGYINMTLPFNLSDRSNGYIGGSVGYRHSRKWSDFYGLDVQASAPTYQGTLGIDNVVSGELRYSEFSTGTDSDAKVDDLFVVLNRGTYQRLESSISFNLLEWLAPYTCYGAYHFADASILTPMEEFKIDQGELQFLTLGATVSLSHLKIKVYSNRVIRGTPDREKIYLLTGLRILADSYNSLGVAFALGI